jgi:serine/threonine protein kinase
MVLLSAQIGAKGRLGSMSAQPQRTCPSCGNELSGAMEFCPVCLLRKGLAGEVESGESSSGDTLKPIPEQPAQRFDYYLLATGGDGRPVELGRGAMGVTYKAFDINLRCPVTLKVINERYLGDESARLRFLREARAAASVRQPNVASVFHLSRTGQNYFYAMEFVEGETLEKLIKRAGRLEVKLALEIATHVAAGLTAVHEQNLVHRDIKPSNIMVRQKEGNAVTAKIIDLGLAKPAADAPADAAISIPGVFAGTPEFASPEQFAGVGVDIRQIWYRIIPTGTRTSFRFFRNDRLRRQLVAFQKGLRSLELPLPGFRPEFDRNTSNAGMLQPGIPRLARGQEFHWLSMRRHHVLSRQSGGLKRKNPGPSRPSLLRLIFSPVSFVLSS